MRYLEFIITHFKGIKDTVTIDLSHIPETRIFTLVGLNESGKTSILEAINLLQNDINEADAHKLIHKSKKSNYTGEVSVKATLKLDEADEERIEQFCSNKLDFKLAKPIDKISFTKTIRFEKSKFINIEKIWDIPLIGTFGKQRKLRKLYDENQEDWEVVVNYIEDNFPKILYYENFLFEFPDRIYLDPDTAKKEGVSEYRSILQDILDSFSDSRTIEEHILRRFNSGEEEDQEALQALSGELEEKLTETIISSWSNVFTSSGNEIQIKIDRDTIGVYLSILIRQGRDKYAIGERSLGFRWFFSFLLFTQFRKERRNEFGETLFLLDEPASNLHQRSQQRLLSVFSNLANDCKIIYSTHSHHLIDPKNLSGTYIVRNSAVNYESTDSYTQRDTDINVYPYRQFVSDYPNETDHFRPVLDAIDYFPSSFELREKIICLEGKNDYYTFKWMASKLGYEELCFYPGAGVNKFESLFRLYMAWDKPLLALFDSDRSGCSAKKKYENDLGPDFSGKIFTFMDICPSWKGYTTESLFSENDKITIQKLVFPDALQYKKSSFNTAIQQSYINDTSIPLSEETIKNFEKVFDFLNNRLSEIQ